MTKGYIKSSAKKSRKAIGEIKHGSIQIIIKDQFTTDIDIDAVMEEVSEKIPHNFLKLIDYIIVGQFEELKKRSVNAAYLDGAIYVTNDQNDEDDMIDDIIHEIAHAVEEESFLHIYSDGRLESEFLSKRERLFHLLDGEEELDLNYQDFL